MSQENDQPAGPPPPVPASPAPPASARPSRPGQASRPRAWQSQWAWWTLAAAGAVVPILMIGSYSLGIADRSIRRLVQSNNLSAATMGVETLSARLRGSLDLVSTMSRLPGVVDAMRRRDVEAIRLRLRLPPEGNNDVDRAFVLDPQGVLWSDWPVAPESLGRNFAHRDYFKGVTSTGAPYVSAVFQRLAEPKPLVIAVSAPVRDAGGELLGVLVLQYRLEAITGWLANANVGERGAVIVLDHEGTVAGHSLLALQSRAYTEYKDLDLVNRARSARMQTVEYTDPLSKQLEIATVLPLALPGHRRWVVIAQQDREAAYAPLVRLRLRIGLAAGIVAIMALGAAMRLALVGERNRRMRLEAAERAEQLERAVAAEREAMEALKRTQSQLVQSEKLAALGQLVAGVAHEINNPLSFVANNVAVLQRDMQAIEQIIALYRQADGAEPERVAELHEQIRQVAGRVDLDYTLGNLKGLMDRSRDGLKRIQQIVVDLREFGRAESAVMQEADLNAAIQSTINILQGQARQKHVEMEFSPGELPRVRCAVTRIGQVVLNLISNGLDACAHDGRVQVRTWREGENIFIEVADDGCGMTADVLKRLFEPFFTTKPQGQGMGLGLSVSYGIVKEQGGAIDVQSEPGKGSRFTVRLPLTASRAE